ncbi:hypothetical protein [Haloarchaeobius sp. HRN-SO-5]|uniref:hypothetical protein n=1 Tax=Haloarchaeobius sp. HRN-SO-5 TaxID=3446118 RepID=UPI003EBFD715
MKPNSDDGTSRRRLLSGIGTFGAVGFGGFPIVSASEDIYRPTVEDALRSDAVRSLTSALPMLKVIESRAKGETVDLSEDTSLVLDSAAYLTLVVVPGRIGGSSVALQYAMIHDGESSGKAEAFLDISDVEALPGTYRRRSSQTDARLVSNGDDVVMFRSGTTEEREQVANALDVAPDHIVIGTNDALDGYVVRTTDGSEVPLNHADTPTVIVETDTAAVMDGRENVSTTATTLTDDEFTTMGECDTWCLTCASGISAAGACLGACAGVTAATAFLGWVSCFVCAQGSGLVSGYACTSCIDCKGLAGWI